MMCWKYRKEKVEWLENKFKEMLSASMAQHKEKRNLQVGRASFSPSRHKREKGPLKHPQPAGADLQIVGPSESLDSMPKKVLVCLSDEVERALRDYVQQEFHGRRGAVGIVVEESLRRFLQEQTKRRLT